MKEEEGKTHIFQYLSAVQLVPCRILDIILFPFFHIILQSFLPLPAYRERSDFLRSLGREDLADIHDYFVYKRLLLFYNQIKKSGMPEKKAYLQKITEATRHLDDYHTLSCPFFYLVRYPGNRV